jgi:two-component system sensor histidine kinase GlrK
MRFTVFWRIALAQLVLFAFLLAMGFSWLFQVRKQSSPSLATLTVNTACLSEEKRLLDLFLFQRRSAEKYLLLRDNAFLEHFRQGSLEFINSLDKVAALVHLPEEHALVGQLRTLHARYSDGLTASGAFLETWKQERMEISERLIARVNELLHTSEMRIERESQAANLQSGTPSPVLGWLVIGLLSLAVALLYFNARGISGPLRQLARELQQVGSGEVPRPLPVHGPSEVADALSSFNQMTERLTELETRQADFLAQMSHELRTPLTAIQEGAALLLEEVPGALNAPQREIVQVVQSNSDRLFRRLASLLELSKMEAHQMEYSLVATDLVALVRRSVESFGPIAQKKQLRLRLSTPSPLPVMYLDEDRIHQVLDNLLSNAVKFTPEGGEIRVSTALRYEKSTGEHWAEVTVSDTGIGVRAEETERIFQKFYQGSADRRQSARGSGLGLAIARHIVEAHGGKIWVESRPGEGATFIFTLPVRRRRESSATREGRPRQSGGRDVL